MLFNSTDCICNDNRSSWEAPICYWKKELLLVGGVSANKELSSMLNLACQRHKVKFNSCPITFAGDNGAQLHG